MMNRPYYTIHELMYFASTVTDSVNLHNFYVREAVMLVVLTLSRLSFEKPGQWEFTIITGKGLHSTNGIPKIKPAVMECLTNYNVKHRVMETNTGRILVQMETVRFF